MLDVIVEVRRDSCLKYEIDELSDRGPTLRLDRILTSSMTYPGNYGYIPGTLSADGDPLDALIVVPYELEPGCVVECRPVGVLIMSDEKGLDEKILVVPVESVDPTYGHIQTLEDIPLTTRNCIVHFFTHYKTHEPGKWSKVEGLKDKQEAMRLIESYKVGPGSKS